MFEAEWLFVFRVDGLLVAVNDWLWAVVCDRALAAGSEGLFVVSVE